MPKEAMGDTERKIREEQAEKKMQAATDKAYNKALTYPESTPPAKSAPVKPKMGVDKGEAGKPWDALFSK